MSRKHPNSLLLIDSIDRYVRNVPGTDAAAPLATYTFKDVYFPTRFNDGAPPTFPTNLAQSRNTFPGNKFSIYANQPLIYGGLDTIALGQIQLYYAVPTITPMNNKFWIANITGIENGSDPAECIAEIIIPYGFYSAVELCAMIEYKINQTTIFGTYPQYQGAMTVVPISTQPLGLAATYEDIFWSCKNPITNAPIDWCFVNPNDDGFANPPWAAQKLTVYKTFDTLSIQRNVCGFPSRFVPPAPPFDLESNISPIKYTPVFKLLYTAYVDILSNKLTKYQDVKDSDTKPLRQTNQIARVYLCGQGAPQAVGLVNAPGSRPFYTVATLTNTKVIQWDPDEAVYDLDFELRDQYGDLLFWDNDVAPTEFQLTLMCSE